MVKVPGRIETITKYKKQGGRIAAVLPIHYPRALMRAFNILPVEVWGPPRLGVGEGAAHLQPYICSIAQNAITYLLSGGLDVADIIIVPHACDSLQGFGSLLIDFIPTNQPVIPIYLPRERREGDIDFLCKELRMICDRLGEITGLKPTDEEITSHIHREEAADALLSELHQKGPYLPITDSDLYRLIRSREYLPAENFMEFAQTTLANLGDNSRVGIPLLLSGIVPEPMSLFDTISELGGIVVGDDMACCGRRLYTPGQSTDPLRRMAERIIFAPPDPTRGNPLQERRDHLVQLAEMTGGKGIIFYEVKFCEPELFDLPILHKELSAAGIPSITIELDLNDKLSQQVRTRIGAFLEMVQ
jgi:benzoyl-CoA reductase/2-hydroxyglutaryl-CoA dehydratase subunit BcrC/BadD/HgdB